MRASEAALSASCCRTIQRLAFIYYFFLPRLSVVFSAFIRVPVLLSKPTTRIQELDPDAPVAIDLVNPRTVHFRRQLAA